MRYPEFLRDGGKIGFIAPSFGCTEPYYRARFDAALELLKKDGYGIVLGPNVYSNCGVGKSNTPEACGAEINDFFVNDRSDIIISCGGGETMCEDLPFVDFDAIAAAKPKWYIGYSDNTNLTFTLPTLCDTAAIYGPGVGDFGMNPMHKAVKDAYDILKGKRLTVGNYDMWEKERIRDEEQPLKPYNLTEPFKMICYDGMNIVPEEGVDISFSGRLIGGCMDCLVNLVGTPFDRVPEFCERYADDGIIWFMEACDLNVMSIRRALWQMEQAGWFKHVKGFLIGRPRLYDDAFEDLDRIGAALGMLGKYNVPVLLDVDLGHLPPMMPVISGACADISAKGNTLELKYRLE